MTQDHRGPGLTRPWALLVPAGDVRALGHGDGPVGETIEALQLLSRWSAGIRSRTGSATAG